VRRIADGLGLGLHELHLHPLAEGHILAEMHLKFAQEVTLAEAHRLAQVFRQRVQAEVPQVGEVLLCLEPLSGRMEVAEAPPDDITRSLEAFLKERVAPGRLLSTWVYRAAGHLHAAIRVALPGAWPLPRAYGWADVLQRAVLHEFASLAHVAVEVTPDGDEEGAVKEQAAAFGCLDGPGAAWYDRNAKFSTQNL